MNNDELIKIYKSIEKVRVKIPDALYSIFENEDRSICAIALLQTAVACCYLTRLDKKLCVDAFAYMLDEINHG